MEILFKELSEHEEKTIRDGINSHSLQHGISLPENINLSFVIYEEKEFIGGVKGHIYHDWLYVSDLWVEPTFRKKGVGTQLLSAIEGKAKEHGIENCYLWTASYEAEEFYQQNGYELSAKLEDKPKGHDSLILRKKL